MHLVDVGCSRDYSQWIILGLGTIMELGGLPCPTDDLLKRLFCAVPQPTPAEHKATASKFPIKPALGLDMDACTPVHPFAYLANLSVAMLLFWSARLST